MRLFCTGTVSVEMATLAEQIESQDDDDLRLKDDDKESTEDCDDKSDHVEADDAEVDCELDVNGA